MYTSSIVSYGCKVLGYHMGPDIEKIHLDFLRYVFGVKRNTNRVMLYFETGRMPLYIKRIIRMFKYWFKLFQTSNCVYKLPMIFYRVNVKTPIFGVVIGQAILKTSYLIWTFITCGSINTTI